MNKEFAFKIYIKGDISMKNNMEQVFRDELTKLIKDDFEKFNVDEIIIEDWYVRENEEFSSEWI
jgi:hypothetical protein